MIFFIILPVQGATDAESQHVLLRVNSYSAANVLKNHSVPFFGC